MIGAHELALVIGTPEIIGLIRSGQAGSFSLEVMAAPSAADQTVPIQDRVHGADRRKTDSQTQALDLLANLRSTPARVLSAKLNDPGLQRFGQAVGLTVGSPRAIGQALEAQILVSLIKLVARLARDIELAAQRRHLRPFEQAGDKTQPFVHLLTLLPGHLRLPQKPKSVSDVPGILCNLCARKHTKS